MVIYCNQYKQNQVKTAMDKTMIEVTDLKVGYDNDVILKNLNFSVMKGEIFVILGGSGSGKSTLLKHMIGLYKPITGDIVIHGQSIVNTSTSAKRDLMKTFGVLYQSGALFASLTLEENITLVLEEHTALPPKERKRIALEKLTLVGLEDYGAYYPAAISGGMKKRAGLARAMALSPDLLFFDEPSAGLDPISSADLDKLLIKLAREHNTTLVVVTHELDSIYTIADRAIMLDSETQSIIAEGKPQELKENSTNKWVQKFLTRDGLY